MVNPTLSTNMMAKCGAKMRRMAQVNSSAFNNNNTTRKVLDKPNFVPRH